MPQLDQVTFISQFFWLCLFFFGFYFVVCKHFLPEMGRILKFRKKKMNLSGEGVQILQQENEKVRASGAALVENGLNAGADFLLSHLQRMESWLSSVVTDTNKNPWRKTNALYVKWVGTHSIRHQLALQGTASPPPGVFFAFILSEKCKMLRGDGKRIPNSAQSTPDSLDQSLVEKRKRESLETNRSAQRGAQGGKSLPPARKSRVSKK